jgi:cytochrome b561
MSDYMVQESSGPLAIRYRSIVVWIHWITAVLLITQLFIGFRFGMFPKGSPARMDAFAWHKTVGAVILLLALLRLAVRLMNAPPPYPTNFPRWERFFAVWNHRLFYFLIIALPLTGLAAVSGRAKDGLVALKFGLSIPAIPGVGEAGSESFGEIHELLVWGTIVLLVLHVGAALKNQFFSDTPVADRMPPFRARD